MASHLLMPLLDQALALAARIGAEHPDAADLSEELRKLLESLRPWIANPPAAGRISPAFHGRYADMLRSEVLPASPNGRISFDEFSRRYSLTRAEEGHLKKSLAMADGLEYDKSTGMISLARETKRA